MFDLSEKCKLKQWDSPPPPILPTIKSGQNQG